MSFLQNFLFKQNNSTEGQSLFKPKSPRSSESSSAMQNQNNPTPITKNKDSTPTPPTREEQHVKPSERTRITATASRKKTMKPSSGEVSSDEDIIDDNLLERKRKASSSNAPPLTNNSQKKKKLDDSIRTNKTSSSSSDNTKNLNYSDGNNNISSRTEIMNRWKKINSNDKANRKLKEQEDVLTPVMDATLNNDQPKTDVFSIHILIQDAVENTWKRVESKRVSQDGIKNKIICCIEQYDVPICFELTNNSTFHTVTFFKIDGVDLKDSLAPVVKRQDTQYTQGIISNGVLYPLYVKRPSQAQDSEDIEYHEKNIVAMVKKCEIEHENAFDPTIIDHTVNLTSKAKPNDDTLSIAIGSDNISSSGCKNIAFKHETHNWMIFEFIYLTKESYLKYLTNGLDSTVTPTPQTTPAKSVIQPDSSITTAVPSSTNITKPENQAAETLSNLVLLSGAPSKSLNQKLSPSRTSATEIQSAISTSSSITTTNNSSIAINPSTRESSSETSLTPDISKALPPSKPQTSEIPPPNNPQTTKVSNVGGLAQPLLSNTGVSNMTQPNSITNQKPMAAQDSSNTNQAPKQQTVKQTTPKKTIDQDQEDLAVGSPKLVKNRPCNLEVPEVPNNNMEDDEVIFVEEVLPPLQRSENEELNDSEINTVKEASKNISATTTKALNPTHLRTILSRIGICRDEREKAKNGGLNGLSLINVPVNDQSMNPFGFKKRTVQILKIFQENVDKN